MSYDIRISCAGEPHGDCEDVFDVSRFIAALEAFPPFRALGVRWAGETWYDTAEYGGLMIYLEGHAPAQRPDGSFDRQAGYAESCLIVVSYLSPRDLERCCEFAVYLARALDAHAWDLQTGEDLAEAPCG